MVFVFSLKEPLFELLREEIADVDVLARETWFASLLLDLDARNTPPDYHVEPTAAVRAWVVGDSSTGATRSASMEVDRIVI